MDIRNWDWIVIGGIAITLLLPYMIGSYLQAKFMNDWHYRIHHPPKMPELPKLTKLEDEKI